MPALLIVIADSARQPLSQRATGIKRAQVKVVILYSPPQTLDEDVVLAATPAIHADFHLASLEHLDEGCAGKLGVHNYLTIHAHSTGALQ
jgi:hypothetical protein